MVKDEFHVIIDERKVKVKALENLKTVLERLKIKNHGLCHDEALISSGKCDLCLVKVGDSIVRSCEVFVNDNLIVSTKDELLNQSRTDSFEILVAQHSTDCEKCHQSGVCKLQDFARVNRQSFKNDIIKPGDKGLESIARGYHLNHDRCIACSLCSDYSSKIYKDGLFSKVSRGKYIRVQFEKDAAKSADLGRYRDLCPTGAIAHDNDRRLGVKGEWFQVDCVGCERSCKLDARTIDQRFIDIRSSDFQLDNSCEQGRKWWQEVDLWRSNIPLALKSEDGRMSPVSREEFLKKLPKKMNWKLLLSSDLRKAESLDWLSIIKQYQIEAKILIPPEQSFLNSHGPDGVKKNQYAEFEQLEIIESIDEQEEGLIVIEPLWRYTSAFIESLSKKSEYLVLFSFGPLIEDGVDLQIERNSWMSSPVLPTRQSESIQGIIELLFI